MLNIEPTVELITIGREILDGRVIDTNSVVIAEHLKPLGLVPRYAQKVDDQLDRIVGAFQIAASRSDIILVTGGLGPTSDDITAQAFAKFKGEPLVMNPEALAQIEAVFQRINRPMNDAQKKQAFLPPSCFIIANKNGTAPGFGLVEGTTNQSQQWYFMPGVPREMIAMLDEFVLPRLPSKKDFRSRTWVTQFTSEGKLQEQLDPVEKKLNSKFEITYRTRFPENHIGLYADCAEPENAKLFETLSKEITGILGETVFTIAEDQAKPLELEEVVLNLLSQNNAVLATVESCTGGLVATRLTNISGSSNSFWGGWVSYDNSVKIGEIAVPKSVIEKQGAVSAETARAMAEGGLAKMKAALEKSRLGGGVMTNPKLLFCVSTTGIAGPTGGTPEKPVGLCYIGLASSNGETIIDEVKARLGESDRARYRMLFAQKALDLVRKTLENQKPK